MGGRFVCEARVARVGGRDELRPINLAHVTKCVCCVFAVEGCWTVHATVQLVETV